MSEGAKHGRARHREASAPVRSSGPISSWLGRHATDAAGSLRKLLRQPFASLMVIMVIAVTLALPAALNLAVRNALAISGGWESALDFSVFLDGGLTVSEAEGLARLIRQRADVESVEFISADEALETFKVQSGFGDALDSLDENPLPHTLIVRPGAANTEASILLLRQELANLPETDVVQVDTEWVQRFHAILDIVRQGVLTGGVLLGAAIVVIIGNTIRLDIQNRRDEIEVTKLIGASDAFVRRPFLWTGFWYGLFGGGFAVGLVQYGAYLLLPAVSRLAGLYDGNVDVLSLDLESAGIVVGLGVGLGLSGSWIAAARHMRRIEPR